MFLTHIVILRFANNSKVELWGYQEVNGRVTFAVPLSKIFALTTSVDQLTDTGHSEAVGYVNLNTSGFNWYGVFADTNTMHDIKGYWLLVAA